METKASIALPKKLVTVASFLLITILISTAVKLYYAYVCSKYIFCDTAIMGSIAKQILNGEFPLFFYGNFYMWAIESWIIAPFFFLFGISNYTVHLGPIFASLLFLISIYYLGKEFKDKGVGAFALIYSAIPPFYFLKYSVIPVGYLSVLPLFGNLILLFALLIKRTRSGVKGLFYFCLLGLLSGIAFWIHYIALYYIVAAAIFLFLNMIISRKFIYYLLGGVSSLFSFFISGLSHWIFCIRYDFICFKLPNTKATLNLLDGLKRFFTYHVPGILGNNLFTVIIFAVAIVFLIINLRPKKDRCIHNNWLPLFFFVSMAILFAQGGEFVKRGAFRYIIPIFSLVPLVIAYFLKWVNSKVRYTGTVILGILVVINAYNIKNGILTDTYEYKAEGRVYSELMEFFREHKIDGVYGKLRDVSTINFLGKDKIFAVRVQDSANPVDDKVMAGRKIAYLLPNFTLKPFFDMLCKSYKADAVNRYAAFYDFKPWGYFGEEIPPYGWKAAANYCPGEARFTFDRNLDRYWSTRALKKSGMYFQIEFPEVYKIYKMQVFNMPNRPRNLPDEYRLLASLDGKQWKLLTENFATGMFWAGPQVVWREEDTLWEVIFPPEEARFVRIEYIGEGELYNFWEINEIKFYKYLGDKEYRLKDYIYNAKKAYSFLKEKKIKFAYTNYWLSEKIRAWSKSSIRTLRIPNNVRPDRPDTSRLMKLDKDTAIVVNSENEKAVEGILSEIGILFQKRHIGNYTCFYFHEEAGRRFLGNLNSLYWTESGIAKINLKELGELLIGSSLNPARYFLGNMQLYLKLYSYYKQHGIDNRFQKIERIIRRKFTPQFKYKVEFSKGIEFLGWSIGRETPIRGNICKIEYFWKVNKGFRSEGRDRIYAFIYFIKDGEILFQNDHILFEGYVGSPEGKMWKETHRLKIPMEVPCGEYSVRLGLWLPEKGERLSISGTRSTSIEIGKIIIEE